MGNILVGTPPTHLLPTEDYIRAVQFQPELQFDANIGSTRLFKVARCQSEEGYVVVKVFLRHDDKVDRELAENVLRLESLIRQLSQARNCVAFQRYLQTDKAVYLVRQYVRHSLYDKVSTRPFMTTLEKRWMMFQVLYVIGQSHKVHVCHGDIKLENFLVSSWNFLVLADYASFKPTYLPVDNPAEFTYFFDTSRRRNCYVAPERFLDPPAPTASAAEPADVVGKKSPEKSPSKQPADPSPTNSTTGRAASEPAARLSPDLQKPMDIFSAGCALIELWSDGKAPFDLPELHAYRQGQTRHSTRLLEGIRHRHLRALLGSMISLRPEDRRTADEYLHQERGRLFPHYFYSFLTGFMQMLTTLQIHSVDDRMVRIHNELESFWGALCNQPDDWAEGEEEEEEEEEEGAKEGGEEAKEEAEAGEVTAEPVKKQLEPRKPTTSNEGLIIITTAVTSCARGLHHCSSKLLCLEALLWLAQRSESEVILDRILPFILNFTTDEMSRIRVAALDTLTECLQLITELTRRDALIFPEYILPSIAPMCMDDVVAVRVAYARNIPLLAEISVRFLQLTQAFIVEPVEADDSSAVDGGDGSVAAAAAAGTGSAAAAAATAPPLRFETELGTLQDMVQQAVSSLLADAAPIVRLTIMVSDVAKLAQFFGPHKTNEILLKHLVTFLNDKNDASIRGAFFDSIVPVAKQVGWEASHWLMPLLMQGLTDPDEFLVVKGIRATAQLAKAKLIGRTGLTAYVAECAAYLVHPNLWIRHEMCALLAEITPTFSGIDVQCKLMPSIQPHLSGEVLQLDRTDILLNYLHPPLKRDIFDAVLRFADINSLMAALEQRVELRLRAANGGSEAVDLDHGMSQSLKNFFKRFTDQPITLLEDQQLLALRKYLLELHKHRASAAGSHSNESAHTIHLQKHPAVCRQLLLSERPSAAPNATASAAGGAGSGKTRTASENESAAGAAGSADGGPLDWQQMFGGGGAGSSSGSTETLANGGGGGVGGAGAAPSAGHLALNVRLLAELDDLQTGDQPYCVLRKAACRRQLETSCDRMRYEYRQVANARKFDAYVAERDLPQGWRLRGKLVAHLHEHRASVTKLTPLDDSCDQASGTAAASGLFASCGIGGTVRVWDVNKLDGNQSINRSTQVYTASCALYSMAAADGGRSLAVAGRDGSLMLLRIDCASSKMALQEARNLEEPLSGAGDLPLGPVVDMQAVSGGPDRKVIMYATLYGTIVCWDLRMPELAWLVRTPLRNGVVTTMCADPTGVWMASGTSGGKVVCWDLRFRLPICEIRHPYDYRIRKIVAHPTAHGRLISSVAGNNEVSIWDIESVSRHGALWASNAPPLTNQGNQNATSSTVCGLVTGTIDRQPFVMTASSDMRIRHWNLSALGQTINCEESKQLDQSGMRVRYVTQPSSPKNCAVVVPAALEPMPNAQYDCRLIDGTAVIYELNSTSTRATSAAAAAAGSAAAASASTANLTTSQSTSSALPCAGLAASMSGRSLAIAATTSTEEQQPRSGPDQPPVGHYDVINDLLLMRSQKQQYLVASASRDGVIKLWK